MRIFSTFLLFTAAIAMGQVPQKKSGEVVTSIRVIASEMVWVGTLSGGTQVTGLINGQPVVLREFKEKNPIVPGDYPIRLTQDNKPHGSERDQRYTLTLQDGKQLSSYLEALCERDVNVCYGVSTR